MRCLCPMTIKNPNQSGPRYIKVPCGKCEACVQRRASDWFVRLFFQNKVSKNSVFVTLTYDDDHLPLRVTDGRPYADVSKSDVRHFLVRLRRYLGPEKSRKLKYFLISEYGPNPTNGFLHRPHYHAIFFNLDPEDYPTLDFSWKAGFTTFGEINEERMRYVSGYSTEKLFCPPGVAPLFAFISNGIGESYIDDFCNFHEDQLDRFFVPMDGQKLSLPRYYKERLYTDAQRKVFSDNCEKRADRVYDNDLRRFGGDIHALEGRYQDQRANYVRRLRKKHKKKQNG